MLTRQRNVADGRGHASCRCILRALAVRAVVGLVILGVAVSTCAAGAARIVTLAPSLTETVFALGAGNRVVGVGDYAVYPPRVARLPHLGGLYNPNIERILTLKPQLILIPSPMPRLEAACGRVGIRVEVIPMDGAGDLGRAILRLGQLLQRPAAAKALADSIHRQLDAVRGRTRNLAPVRVLLVIDRPSTGPLRDVTTVGHGSFLDTLVETAGGRNIFSDVHRRYFTAALEEILRRKPQMILELDAGARHPKRLEHEARRAWSALFGPGHAPPVRVVTSSIYVVPGPRAGLAAARLAVILHPGLEKTVEARR